MTNIDLDYLARQNADILEELKALRKEIEDIKASTSQTAEFNRRNDPRRPNGLNRR